MNRSLHLLNEGIVACRACPRLVSWREKVARTKRAAYRDWTYWGRPLPGFGDPEGSILLLGLAPGAHGGNRTGRVFTGDRSGDFLYAALHRAGLASQPTSTSREDGLRLHRVFITLPVRCTPPDNRPTPAEFARCASFLDRELPLLPELRVVVALGALAWRSYLGHASRGGLEVRPLPKFGHGAEAQVGTRTLLGSYHVSQQNTQTGRLTSAMFDAILSRALILASRSGGAGEKR